ncbi:hypothetical protein ANN_24638 [Periplaneta americana]|uniref:Uncharacterized protein n=1 Tax=Periplaneta americana TaxID=6978 RepID=A0ABQ8S3K8_PERAM|nr:hypothetical protein ANN_24638 [Periplaneta americana]
MEAVIFIIFPLYPHNSRGLTKRQRPTSSAHNLCVTWNCGFLLTYTVTYILRKSSLSVTNHNPRSEEVTGSRQIYVEAELSHLFRIPRIPSVSFQGSPGLWQLCNVGTRGQDGIVRDVCIGSHKSGIVPIEIDLQLYQTYGPNVMSKQMVRCSTRSSVMMVGLPLRSSSGTFWHPVENCLQQQRTICLPIDLAQLTINFNRRYAIFEFPLVGSSAVSKVEIVPSGPLVPLKEGSGNVSRIAILVGFSRDGVVNFRNQHVWADENPHADEETGIS